MAISVLNGIPDDLLNSKKEGARRLKVEAVVVDAGATPESGLIKTDITYLANGNVNTIIKTNLATNVITEYQYNWNTTDPSQLDNITPTIL